MPAPGLGFRPAPPPTPLPPPCYLLKSLPRLRLRQPSCSLLPSGLPKNDSDLPCPLPGPPALPQHCPMPGAPTKPSLSLLSRQNLHFQPHTFYPAAAPLHNTYSGFGLFWKIPCKASASPAPPWDPSPTPHPGIQLAHALLHEEVLEHWLIAGAGRMGGKGAPGQAHRA